MSLAVRGFASLPRLPLAARASASSREVIEKDRRFGARHYRPLPVAVARARGVFVWDMEGRRYWDFLGGFSAVNQGHCHPRLVAAMAEQMKILHHVSRSFHTDVLADFSEAICETFSYDRVVPMNSGVEACETACKLARKWGYEIKGIPRDRAKIVFAEGNFWGRTLAAVSTSDDPVGRDGFGPRMPGFLCVPYDDLAALELALRDPEVCAFMAEPIQGEAGVRVPAEGYLRGVRRLCAERGVLWIADEVQTGLGRTGRMLCVDHEGARPDVLVLGKSLAGGLYPVSAVLADDAVMRVLTPGTHGSTFGGNALGCRVAIEGLRVVVEENLAENAETVGRLLRERLSSMTGGIATAARGKGLMNAVDVDPETADPWELCLRLRDAGFLTKPTRGRTLRLTPPLTITPTEMHEAMDVLESVLSAARP